MNQGKKPNLTYFRDRKSFEVDTIAGWKHIFTIEIKSTNAPEAKLSATTKKYLALRGNADARNAVFYLGDISMNINGTSYVSRKDWGDFLSYDQVWRSPQATILSGTHQGNRLSFLSQTAGLHP